MGGTSETPPTDALRLDDEDIYEAMRQAGGYLDITPGDFKQIYSLAFQHAWERLVGGRRASEVMTRPVVSLKAEDSLAQVVHVMAREGVAGVPVLENGFAVGMISEKDVLKLMGGEAGLSFMAVVARCLSGEACGAVPLRRRLAREVMSSPLVKVGPETGVAEIAALMARESVNRIPVVDQDGGLLGIVTRSDLLPRSGEGDQR
ncbi:MAG: CBS domain-containing protein [Desulfarculaceae bacterium]|nr:CBS domain-containing protein [Desulfarculaceae bacterium]